MPTQVITTDVEAEVLYNDGEALLDSDMLDMQRIDRRLWSKAFLRMSEATDSFLPLRPLRTALQPRRHDSTNIRVDPGIIFWALTDPGGRDYGSLVFSLDNQIVITYDPNVSGLTRYDILSVKLEKEDETPISRDFKDATTGALSTQSFAKIRGYKMTLTYTPGVPDASPVEPAVPAGEEKIARIEVPSGTPVGFEDVIDFRYPAGNTTMWSQPGDMVGWPELTTGFFSIRDAAGAGDDLIIPGRPQVPIDTTSAPMRLLFAEFVYLQSGSMGAALVRVNSDSTFTTLGTATGLSTGIVDLGVIFGPSDPPAWHAGFGGPVQGSATFDIDHYLALWVEAGAANDRIWTARFRFYGGM